VRDNLGVFTELGLHRLAKNESISTQLEPGNSALYIASITYTVLQPDKLHRYVGQSQESDASTIEEVSPGFEHSIAIFLGGSGWQETPVVVVVVVVVVTGFGVVVT
jgi:hypothetical protein